ncbi:MAG: UPF0280 family protein [Pseudomonadota bacterium]|nr:UPF0280 family protein [Pseudomonadota bacterium]
MEYRERTYRQSVTASGLVTFQVALRETDLLVAADVDLTEQTRLSVLKHRAHLESYIERYPAFLHSLAPLPNDPLAPPIVRTMLAAAKAAGVGPMAAVAGALSDYVGRDLSGWTKNLIVENGGDIFLHTTASRRVAVFAGPSPWTGRLTLEIAPEDMPLGICTSSATVGPSLSFGKADAVCVLSSTAALADAAASRIGNMIRSPRDIKKALQAGRAIQGTQGIVIVLGDKLGVWGKIKIST